MLWSFIVNIRNAWVICLKDKKGTAITNACQKILNANQIKYGIDKGSEFYNKAMKPWLEKNDKEMYSTYNQEKSVIAEGFLRTLENKIYKYMTSVSKNVYIDKLDDIINKYDNTYQITIKIKPVDVKSNTYINSTKEINDKDPKFTIGDIVRISKYKIIFVEGYIQNWSEEDIVIKEVKNAVPSTYVRGN